MPRARRLSFLLIGLFVLISGALALSYEVVWARKLVPLFGSDAVSVAVVVSLFMLGLGLGARLAGRFGDALSRPLVCYAWLEVGLGLWAVATPWMIDGFSAGLVLAGGWLGDSGLLLTLARVLIGAMLLLPPTLVMGASLPLLARFAVNEAGWSPDRVINWYALNLVGAVAGVFLAGFVLLPLFPMSRLLLAAGSANILLALLLLALALRVSDRGGLCEHEKSIAEQPGSSAGSRRWIAMSALVGVASMICQIAWTRTIVLVVGGSAYAFSAVLGVFLAGLGLGAWLASASLARWPGQTIELYVLVSLAVIAALFGSLAMLPVLPGLFLNWFDAEWSGLRGGIFVLQAGSAAALFLLPTTLMGALFPLLLRQMLDQDGSAALATSRVYLANTLGCVAGALAAGLVLIPAIGITPTLVLAIGLFCYALLLGAIRIERPVFRVSACAAMFLSFTIGWYLTPPWNSQLMSAGVSEQARRYVQLEHMSVAEHLKDQYDLLFYRDGPTATVSVSRERWSVPRHLFISTNGKVDGSSWGDMPTQKLSAHLPLLMHPWPETVAVVGMGTGVTAGSATLHDSVEQVSVLEIEPAMVEGARLFAEYNHRVHDNPKSLIRVIDGRFHLSLFEDRYDVIISEPSNPWVAGVASLFTREFYQLGARALKEGGVFAQWIQIYDISPDNLRSVVRSFHEVFPYTYGAVTIVGSDLLLIGSVQPFMIDVEDMRQRLRDPLVSEDLADPAVGVHSVWELLARVWLAPTGIERLADGGRLHRDDWPFLMYEAPLTRYLGGRQQNMQLVADVAGDVDRFLTDGLDSSQQYQWLSAYEAYVPEALRWWVTGLQQGQ